MSESSPTITGQNMEEWRTKIGSVGRAVPNSSIKIMSEAGELVKTGSLGEICISGPQIFAGYLNNPEATANCMQFGYFKTGDVGFLDHDKHLFTTSPLKELIKYKGFQVAPTALESLLLGHEHVADVCVLGVYDNNQATELPRAYIVKSEGAKNVEEAALEKSIKEWVDGKVASHKRLRGGIHFVDEIPKLPSGKILRRILKERKDKS